MTLSQSRINEPIESAAFNSKANFNGYSYSTDLNHEQDHRCTMNDLWALGDPRDQDKVGRDLVHSMEFNHKNSSTSMQGRTKLFQAYNTFYEFIRCK